MHRTWLICNDDVICFDYGICEDTMKILLRLHEKLRHECEVSPDQETIRYHRWKIVVRSYLISVSLSDAAETQRPDAGYKPIPGDTVVSFDNDI